MNAKAITLLCVGKLKTDYWGRAFEHYKKMLEKWRPLHVREIKDAPGHLPPEKRIVLESGRLAAAMETAAIHVALAEQGQTFTSSQFASLLRKWQLEEGRPPCFIIGGPFGLSQEIIGKCQYRLSLSPMTWPHELARVLLMEQLYRAHAILANTGYHH